MVDSKYIEFINLAKGVYGGFDVWAIFSFIDKSVYFNGPIWFLLSLFWVNLIFCVITLGNVYFFRKKHVDFAKNKGVAKLGIWVLDFANRGVKMAVFFGEGCL